MHLTTPFKCMLTLALHLPCNWRPQNGTMNKAEQAEWAPLSSLWLLTGFANNCSGTKCICWQVTGPLFVPKVA